MNQKAFYLPETQVKKTLAASPTIGKKLLEPLKEIAKNNNLPFNILEDHQLTANDAEVHQREADLWLCLEGKVDFVCDGEMVEPWYKKLADGSEDRHEVKAKYIRGGTTYVLKPGAWWGSQTVVPNKLIRAGSGRLVIIKIPADKQHQH